MPGVATTVNASNNNEESLEEDLKTLFAIYANNEDRILAEVERIGIPIIEELLNLHKFPFHSTKNLLKETNLKVYSLIEDAAPTAFIQFEWKSAGGKVYLVVKPEVDTAYARITNDGDETNVVRLDTSEEDEVSTSSYHCCITGRTCVWLYGNNGLQCNEVEVCCYNFECSFTIIDYIATCCDDSWNNPCEGWDCPC